MANEVEQLLQDVQRKLNERNLSHRETISNVMSGVETALVRYGEKMAEIHRAEVKLEEARRDAFAELREAFTHETATLVLVRDMHPVLLEEGGEQKKIANGSKKS